MAITASDFKLPGGIETYEDYKKAQAAPKYYESSADINEEMGQQEFLLLFTTQLENQNPLDPMKNEEFVAQLAQFSQLEATTTMAADLKGLTGALQKERMMTGASLIGKKVQVPNGPAMLEEGKPISGVLSLDSQNGAESVTLSVYDANGKPVRTIPYGRKSAGDFTVSWDGKNDTGEKMPDGQYTVIASVKGFDGSNNTIPISTPSVITAVTYNAQFDDLVLEVANGATVNFSQVRRIDAGPSVISDKSKQQQIDQTENTSSQAEETPSDES
ncbi:MAG: hypothetical protein CBD16_00330 [Betaproteobacteria bacterium TMED156]|nr:MAG: hypothetical protein CBD16_00330 [Betaproteobacteria bacterium TMED156]